MNGSHYGKMKKIREFSTHVFLHVQELTRQLLLSFKPFCLPSVHTHTMLVNLNHLSFQLLLTLSPLNE